MDEEAPNAMNLDLNLGPNNNSSNGVEPESGFFANETMSLEDWLPVNRLREAVRQRRRQRWRPVWRQFQVSPEARSLALGLDDGIGLHVGEGSISAEERPSEGTKTCDGNDGFLDDEVLGKKDQEEKGNADAGGFFDCNICLDLADDPVVTCCGHLFCWPCLYRWLHLHSDAKECPVCKGEVTLKNVTPIYGRGKSVRQPMDDINLKVPLRPQARRIESWRQAIQRSGFSVPMEEMIRRLGNRFDLSQVHPHNADAPQEVPDRSNSLLNRILTSRGLRREHNSAIPPEDAFDDANPSNGANPEATDNRQIPSAYLRRTNSSLAVTFSNLASRLSSAERVVESYLLDDTVERNQEQHQQQQPHAVDDRDSMSSIAAVIYSNSQSIDTTFETDSTVSLSTSSSRRRHNASRVSDVDSGDSRAPRRRRLN